MQRKLIFEVWFFVCFFLQKEHTSVAEGLHPLSNTVARLTHVDVAIGQCGLFHKYYVCAVNSLRLFVLTLRKLRIHTVACFNCMLIGKPSRSRFDKNLVNVIATLQSASFYSVQIILGAE